MAEIPKGVQAAVIAAAIRLRGVVIALACVLIGYGALAVTKARYNVFPDFAPPQVTIQTEAPGLSAEDVEALVTRPIETAINGSVGVETVRSTSMQGVSAITVLFRPTSSILVDRQTVSERLAVAAQQLPKGVGAPTMTPLTSSTATLLIVGLTSSGRTLMDVRTAADWTVKPALMAVPGVAEVSVYGRDVRSLQVQIHPDRLVRFGLGMDQVVAAAQKATGVLGGGFVDTSNQRLVLQSSGQPLTPGEVARTVVASTSAGRVVLGDVADVVDAPEPPFGAALIDGKPGVFMVVSEQFGANSLEVSRAALARLEELRPALAVQGIALDTTLFRASKFVTTALSNIRSSLILGGILVAAVLFLFLFELRTAAISCLAIPLSLLGAVAVLVTLGVSLNVMALGGLAIATGEVVDDAVIGIENIARRLRENRRSAAPRPPARVVLDAALEVRSSVIYATFAVILVFLPVLGLSGVAGRLFAPLGQAYVLAVLASLVVAMTVTPALAMIFLVRDERLSSEPPVVRWSHDRYRSLVAPVMSRPRLVLAGCAAIAVLSLAALPLLRADFLPELKEGHYVIHVSEAPGASLGESLRIGGRITAALLRVPSVRSVAQQVGRAERGIDVDGPQYSELQVDLRPLTGKAAERADADVRRAVEGIPGVAVSVNTVLGERIEETVSGYTAPVAVSIYGDDLDVLDKAAARVAAVMSRMRGSIDVLVQSPPGQPQISVRLRQADLERWGLDPISVLEAVRTAYEGDTVGQLYDHGRAFDLVAILAPQDRKSIDQIERLPLHRPEGGYVLLRQVADVFMSSGRYEVQHNGGRRRVTVTTNVRGRSVSGFVRDLKAAVARGVSLPPGAYVSYAGTAQAQARSARDLVVNSLIAAVGVVLLVSIITRSWPNLLLVLANLPFALAGGILAVLATGGRLTLGEMVGFVTVLGISLRNSILMVAHFEQLVTAEGRPWNLATAVDGAVDRLAPILMTSLVTALGLLPLAVGMNDPGREIEGPMAVVILGGLITSMVLNLFALPALALAFGRFAPKEDEFSSTTARGTPS